MNFARKSFPYSNFAIFRYISRPNLNSLAIFLSALKAGKIENEKLKVETELAKLSR